MKKFILDGWMDGWMDGRTDGRMDGRTDGRTSEWMMGGFISLFKDCFQQSKN